MADDPRVGQEDRVIINKIDLLRTEEDRHKIIEFVRENIERLLGFSPEIFPSRRCSPSRRRMSADRNPAERDRLWEASRFEPLENYIFDNPRRGGAHPAQAAQPARASPSTRPTDI